MAHNSLKVAVISWNLANHEPNSEDIAKLLTVYRGNDNQEVDAIIVMAQEEPRSQTKSLAYKIKSELGYTQQITREFNTWTTALGKVSLSVISNKKIHSNRAAKFHHRNGKVRPYANKGGLCIGMQIDGVQFNLIGAHLDSKYDKTRLYETNELITTKLEGINNNCADYISYQEIASRASNVDIFGGDFNYRDIYVKKGNSRDPFTSKEAPIKKLAFEEFQCINQEEKTYAYKNISPAEKLKAGEQDKCRTVANTNLHYCRGGRLDRIFYRTFNTLNNQQSQIVTNTTSSDHAPVVATFKINKTNPNDSAYTEFQRCKLWVAKVLEPLAAKEIIQNIKNAEDTEENRHYIASTYNYYTRLKQVEMDGEQRRLQGKTTEANAINGKHGLVAKMKTAGNQFFKETNCLRANNEQKKRSFSSQLEAYIENTIKKTASLNKDFTFLEKMKNFFISIRRCLFKTGTQIKAKPIRKMHAVVKTVSLFQISPKCTLTQSTKYINFLDTAVKPR